MGLDHGLTASVTRYNFQTKLPQMEVKNNPLTKPFEHVNLERIEYNIFNWRKQNHFHNWFVENIQNGEDDQMNYHIKIEQLEEFYNVCQIVIQDLDKSETELKSVWNGETWYKKEHTIHTREEVLPKDISTAKKLLPTSEGFFFGSTDYDSWYIESIREAIQVLEPIIEQMKDSEHKDAISFWYHSDW